MKILQRIRRWLTGNLGEENKRLAGLLVESASVISGLNVALAHAIHRAQSEQQEKLVMLGAVALQNDGEIRLPREFVDAVQDGNHRVEFSNNEEKTVLIIRLRGVTKADTPQESGGGCGCQDVECSECE